jgi:hypothetical protein
MLSALCTYEVFMKASEIILQARGLMKDTKQTYLWSETELVQYLNSSHNEAAEKAKLFLESVNSAICRIPILAADPDPDYPIDNRIVEVLSAKLSTQSRPLYRRKRTELELWNPDWRNAAPGTPRWFLTDYTEGHLTLHQKSNADATLYLTVYRLPLVRFTADNIDTEPEIHFRHHYRLVEGILAQAYNKDDSETLDPQKADRHQKAWLKHIDEMSRARLRMHQTHEFLGPNYGAI